MRMADKPADGLAVEGAVVTAPDRAFRMSRPAAAPVLTENGLHRGAGFYAAPVADEHGPNRAREHVIRENGRQER
jgi:hypothetical protein